MPARTLDEAEQGHTAILCDIWGCIHNGVRLYPGALERLVRWREQDRRVALITNAPRTAEDVARRLLRFGLDEELWDGIATAGDAGIAGLLRLGKPVGFIGTPRDRSVLEGKGVRIANDGRFDALACAGLDGIRDEVADYVGQLQPLAARGVVMHCLNPDRVVTIGDELVLCAGALADLYLDLGGQVEWYGKPFPAIYRHALHLAGDPQARDVLAIGDGLETDMLGAARMGFDCVYVTGGIGQGRLIPPGFAAHNGLGDWQPVAVIDSIG